MSTKTTSKVKQKATAKTHAETLPTMSNRTASKGKQKANGKVQAQAPTTEDIRLASMRAVNAASQSLSALLQSKDRSVANNKTALGAASTASKALRELRMQCPGDVDVERASSSVIGKLIAIEMFDTALSALAEMRPTLASLYGESLAPVKLNKLKPGTLSLDIISLPKPSTSAEPLSDILQQLISTYFLHSLTCVLSCPTLPDPTSLWGALNKERTLLHWIEHLPSLPSKHRDSALTKGYSLLAKVTTTLQNSTSPRLIFSLRTYALHLLLLTTPGSLEANTFWDQVFKFCLSFVKSSSAQGDTEDAILSVVMGVFREVVDAAERREDAGTWMAGRGFVGALEYWMGFAKRIGDVAVLDRISALMQGTSPAASPSSSTTSKPSQYHQKELDSATAREPLAQKEKDASLLEGARICAVFAQTTALLEQWIDEPQSQEGLTKRMREASALLPRCRAVLLSCDTEENESEELERIKAKTGRALERLRRAGIKIMDTRGKGDTGGGAIQSLRLLMWGVVGVLESEKNNSNLTPALDTLFTLARTSLIPSDQSTYGTAYEYLVRANKVVASSGSSESELANYVRCISGAFHNLAGSLYQDGKYAGAVRFLKEGCILGVKALGLWRKEDSEKSGKGDEGWKLLKEQLYRRWELLGVCYSKMGDRRPAYEAFVESVKAYPFMDTEFIQLTRTCGSHTVFNMTSGLRQLATIIDRAAYLGTCELLLTPSEISLKGPLEALALCSETMGAILERQVESLEGNLWKEGVREVVKALLLDALSVYSAAIMPIRRARVLIRCLEFGYKAGDQVAGRHADDFGEEAQDLLGREALAQDSGSAQFCPQYRATMHLWLGLHAHRRVDARQISLVAHHSEEAFKVLKALLEGSTIAESRSKAKKPSPGKKHPKVALIAARGKGRLATKAKAAPARRGAPISKLAKVVEPVTPQPHKALEAVAVNAIPPGPTSGEIKKAAIVFEDFDRLLALLQMSSQLLGLLGLVLAKVKLLDVSRRVCERCVGASHDGYMLASIDLAHEYVKLGKTGKASMIYGQTLIAIRNRGPSDEVRVKFLLRYSESLATVNNVLRSSSTYCEALGLAGTLPGEEKGMTTSQKVSFRVGTLERAAMAAYSYGVIQYAREDLNGSLDGMLQSLRLWNRAMDTLARLAPPAKSPEPSVSESNPFEMTSLKNALLASGADPSKQAELAPPKKTFTRRASMNGLEWRICDGLLATLFALSRTYLTRGSAREAEYFSQQAQDLAESLNAPAMISRALAKKGEIQIHQGQLEDGYNSLIQATELLGDIPGIDAADIRRLRGYYHQLKATPQNASESYAHALEMLEEFETQFSGLDTLPTGPRKSTGLSPRPASGKEIILPSLLALVLRQHIWLLRDDINDECRLLLERFADLPISEETKGEENGLMAQLTLHEVYGRFRSDMFLSSLVESTIALPVRMSSEKLFSMSPSTQEILAALDNAEKLFWADLSLVSRKGRVSRVRDATLSLAMIRALQSSLGRAGKTGPVLTASLLGASTAITLRREMLESIEHKFPEHHAPDDLQWPLITPNGSPLPQQKIHPRVRMAITESDDEDEEHNTNEVYLRRYWRNIRDNYRAQPPSLANLSTPQANRLPKNWTVISINITEDKGTIFVTRQRAEHEPLIFCVPLKGRRETEDDEHLTFDDALNELKQIIALSNQGTREAVHVKNDDLQARANWWSDRSALDTRLQELLENIEFCWLGAFKTILSQPTVTPPEIVTDLRTRLDKVFKRSLHSQERKQKSKILLDDNLLSCFSALSPKCRDEELEDLVYFILDLYQFHGVPVAISEVDVDQVIVDLRSALEEHAIKAKGKIIPEKDSHTFLVLDKNVQGIPWESIPIMRGHSISRIPSMDFLIDRLDFVNWQKNANHQDQVDEAVIDRASVDPKKTYYILNPSGDLKGTEGRFSSWLKEMHECGWEGTIGRPPSEQQFLDALSRKDLVVYFGHGGGEQYIRSHKIRHLPRCAATMLWGCSSGALREMGDFDRVGTPYNYMLAGCPTLVANLWDVTDRDIDKFSQAVFDKLRLTKSGLRQSSRRGPGTSLIAAVAQSRSTCRLKYLTGAAPVVYGIPFYL